MPQHTKRSVQLEKPIMQTRRSTISQPVGIPLQRSITTDGADKEGVEISKTEEISLQEESKERGETEGGRTFFSGGDLECTSEEPQEETTSCQAVALSEEVLTVDGTSQTTFSEVDKDIKEEWTKHIMTQQKKNTTVECINCGTTGKRKNFLEELLVDRASKLGTITFFCDQYCLDEYCECPFADDDSAELTDDLFSEDEEHHA